MDLCFATNNKGKLLEVKSLVSEKYKILSLADIGCHEELPETQPDLEGNSRQKAEYIYRKYKVNCFADDTGLEVEALNGAPGVISARYAGPACSPEDNMVKLLTEMQGVENRKAVFRAIITLFLNGNVYAFEGKVEGYILKERRGEKGFGYDPIFQPAGQNQTFAEMDISLKNEISHRGKAVNKLIGFLNNYKG
ncbi:MAG: non-canonical purine NTP diphosphatase [Cytophagaceae bacterium]